MTPAARQRLDRLYQQHESRRQPLQHYCDLKSSGLPVSAQAALAALLSTRALLAGQAANELRAQLAQQEAALVRAEASYSRREGGINAHRKPWLSCHQADVRDTQELLQRMELCTAAIHALAAARAVSGELAKPGG
jgi:hypothetical protein